MTKVKTEKTMIIVFIILAVIAVAAIAVKFIFFPEPDKNSTTVMLSADSREKLKEIAPSDERIQYIYDNLDLYSVEIIEFLINRDLNEKNINYAYKFPQYVNDNSPIEFTDEEMSQKIPMLFQYDPRWGYKLYGGDGTSYLAYQGCFNTCFTMAYIALTHKTDVNPYSNSVELKEQNLLAIMGTKPKAVVWLAEKYGFECEQYLFDENNKPQKKVIIDALANDKIVFCNVKPGTISQGEHALILREYKDGKFYFNDPSDKENCYTPYDFDALEEDFTSMYILSN